MKKLMTLIAVAAMCFTTLLATPAQADIWNKQLVGHGMSSSLLSARKLAKKHVFAKLKKEKHEPVAVLYSTRCVQSGSDAWKCKAVLSCLMPLR